MGTIVLKKRAAAWLACLTALTASACGEPVEPDLSAYNAAGPAEIPVEILGELDEQTLEKLVEELEGDEKTGARIIAKALEAPIRQIAANAGLDGSVVLENVKKANKGTGFDAYKEEYVDMIAAGILDPAKVTAAGGESLLYHLFENLMRWTDGGDGWAVLSPGQAESYSVDTDFAGNATYTFTLREDARWSDGKPVTAGDFVYSWQRLVTPETAADYLEKWVYSVKDHDELLDKVGGSRLMRLKNEPHLGYSTQH